MTKYSGWVAATALAAALILPIAAGAEDQNKGGGAPQRAAPAAPRAAPAAPHFAAPAAPRMSAPQRAFTPHVSAPQRVVTPRISTPQQANVPRFNQQRAVQHITPRNNPASVTVQNRVVPKVQSNAAATQVQTISPAAQRRADRVERLREQRVLRSLPANQHAAKREEFRQQRLNAQGNTATPNVTVQTNAIRASSALAQQRNLRRNGGTALTAQAARQGRFASRFAGRVRTANADPTSARSAWRHHHRAAFVGWFGPVFWPYAYSDVFDYAFWPYGYDDGYWDYAYDNFFDGLFWGEAGPPADYAYNEPTSTATRVTYAGVQELCNDPGGGVTAWPFNDIVSKVGLNAEQKSLLDQMRSAAKTAATAFKASCPAENAFPLTPPGRLTAMTARLDATLQAVTTVRPALEAFYNSLSDEQKERFNELGPSTQVAKAGTETTGTVSQDGNSCKQPKPGLANLPIETIENVVKPTDAQEEGLNALQDATSKAVSIMQAACPDETPLTPTGRLDAMQKRLQAMIDAANTVKPALTSFYSSLSNEQKARFNRIGEALAGANG